MPLDRCGDSMRENEWTPKRKSLCNQFWDDCAQEECEEPCEVVIKAEKLTYKDIEVFNKGNVREIIPDRTKCFMCKHVFTVDEIRWASPVRETLCNACHADYLSAPMMKQDKCEVHKPGTIPNYSFEEQ
jgi:hypothetical protein